MEWSTYLLLYQVVSIGLATARKRTKSTSSFKGRKPIIGASVFVKDTAKGVVAGSDGAFDSGVPSSAKTMACFACQISTDRVHSDSYFLII